MTPDAAWLEVAPQGAQTALVLYPRALMNNWSELKPSIVFHFDDVERTTADRQLKGLAIIDPPKRMQWGVYARFADPEGNEFLLASTTV